MFAALRFDNSKCLVSLFVDDGKGARETERERERERIGAHIVSSRLGSRESRFAVGQYVHHLCMSPIVCFTIAMFNILKTMVKVSLVIHRLTLLSFHSKLTTT